MHLKHKRNEVYIYLQMTTFARIASRAFTGKSTDVIYALATIDAGIRFAFIVFKIAQFTGKSWG
jgi:hypothetical protein